MNKRLPTFTELLSVHREKQGQKRPLVKAKPLNLPTDPVERAHMIREVARQVIERHYDELERLAHK